MTAEHVDGEHPTGHSPGDRGSPRTGRVSFVGAGPGAADLITLRGARLIAGADLVIWSASLVPAECVQEHARAEAELVDSSRIGHEELVELFRRAERERLRVVRLHSGDPTLWGSVQEQHDACVRMGLDVEIVPGVTGFSAAAAAMGKELTSTDADQPVLVSRMDGGRVAMPDSAGVVEFARRGATMVVSVSAARTGRLVEELRAGGYGDDVPVVVAHKPTAPDGVLTRTTLGELESTVKQHKLWRNTMFLVGTALADKGGARRSTSAYRGGDGGGTGVSPSGGRAGSRRSVRWSERAGSGGSRGRRDSPVAGQAVAAAHADAEVAEAVPEPRVQDVRKPGQPDSAIAWWAVRDWQRTARDATRGTAVRASPRPESAQPELFVADDEEAASLDAVGTAEAAAEAVPEQSVEQPPTSAAGDDGAEAAGEPEEAAPDDAERGEADVAGTSEPADSEEREETSRAKTSTPGTRGSGKATSSNSGGSNSGGSKSAGAKSTSTNSNGSNSNGSKQGGSKSKSAAAKSRSTNRTKSSSRRDSTGDAGGSGTA